MLDSVVENCCLDFRTDPVGMWVSWATTLLDQRPDPTDLEGSPDLVEGVSVVAHDAAGLGNVLQLVSEL